MYANLEKNNKVSILFSHVSDYNFLSVNGMAEISQDREGSKNTGTNLWKPGLRKVKNIRAFMC